MHHWGALHWSTLGLDRLPRRRAQAFTIGIRRRFCKALAVRLVEVAVPVIEDACISVTLVWLAHPGVTFAGSRKQAPADPGTSSATLALMPTLHS